MRRTLGGLMMAALLAVVVAAPVGAATPLSGGNAVTSRAYLDTYSNFIIVDKNNPISASGELTSWSFWAGATSGVQLVVVRVAGGVATVVAESPVVTSATTGVAVTTALSPALAVQANDYVGLYFTSTGVVPFDGIPSSGTSGTVLYTMNGYGDPTVGATLTFEGAVDRMYSVSVSGYAPYVFPSTNDLNKAMQVPGRIGQVAPYVEAVSAGCQAVTLRFVNGSSSLAYFEYRIDGVLKTSGTSHPVVTGDFIYPGVSVTGPGTPAPASKTQTFTANATVEIRLALGGERDWDFNWVPFNVPPSDCDGPITTNVEGSPNPIAINDAGTVTANVDDSTTGGSDIASAEYNVDGTGWLAMSALDGTFDEVSEDVTASFTAPANPGIYDLCVRGTDVVSNVGEPTCTMLVVFDPSGGFVTGGGWIMSPEGAYAADPTLTGKATFGFVSKYKKGASVPDGNTEFQFKAGGLNFSSTSYQWLVVNQNYTNAQFKGTGTINGSGNYGFMLWAKDGSPDTFRIKIWDAATDAVVYDNATSEVLQAIGGGSIVVHK